MFLVMVKNVHTSFKLLMTFVGWKINMKLRSAFNLIILLYLTIKKEIRLQMHNSFRNSHLLFRQIFVFVLKSRRK